MDFSGCCVDNKLSRGGYETRRPVSMRTAQCRAMVIADKFGKHGHTLDVF